MTPSPEQTVSLTDLRRSAFLHRDMTSSFEWFKRQGWVPADVTFMKVRQALVDLDPEAMPLGYLASSAFEWDTWGEASPVDFVKAMAADTRGARRDLILETLSSLGRVTAEAVA